MGPPKDHAELPEENRRASDHSRVQGIIDGLVIACVPAVFIVLGALWDRTGDNASSGTRRDSDLKRIESHAEKNTEHIRKMEWRLLPRDHEE